MYQYQKAWAAQCANRIMAERITEPELVTMRKILKNALNAGGYFNGRKECASATADDARELLDLVERVKPQVEYQQAEKGAAHLHALAFCKDGTQRHTETAREFQPRDLQVIRDLQIDPMFRLVMLDARETSHGYVDTILPIYRAIGAAHWFDYVAPSWQSGALFCVINRGGN